MTTRMIVLGDSILWGTTGFDSAHPRANPTIPDAIGSALGWTVDNQAIGGTRWADVDNKDNFLEQVAKFNFKNYNVALLGYGINDYDDFPYSAPKQIIDAMATGVAKMRSDNPAIRIYIELPTPSYAKGSDDGVVNEAGYSQRQIYDTIKQEAATLNLPSYDWRDSPLITYANRNQTLGDGQIHPVNAIQQQMAARLASWIKSLEPTYNATYLAGKAVTAGDNSSSGVVIDHDNTPSIDWSTLDNGRASQPSAIVTTPKFDKITLETINVTCELNSKFNSNVSKIINAMCKIAGVNAAEVGWTAKSFTLLNRACRNYLIDTVLLLRQTTIDLLGSTEIDDGNGNLVSVEAMTPPTSLIIDEVITELNTDFKNAATALNLMIDQLNQGY
ncbi:SGNH/GDSL hydrolase family protein [Limosilactobacillus gastricus]|uniref:SGNH/GDSL hydrolase family protein n=1 Tax=Limosilactobacillus gastricus TaxID=227942 RepID=UPI0026E973A1|nr:SGNH/GDSL hydrolase family protein [Limosilactobacillus gastricus]